MSKKWAYIFAVVLLALVGVAIYAAVHIPGLHRSWNSDKQALGRLSTVAVKVMPGNVAEYPIEFKYEAAVQDVPAMASYRIEANPEAQKQFNQVILGKLTDAQQQQSSQWLGEFVSDGYAYTILINPTDTQSTIVVVENGPVVN